jgi:hypothetical protein
MINAFKLAVIVLVVAANEHRTRALQRDEVLSRERSADSVQSLLKWLRSNHLVDHSRVTIVPEGALHVTQQVAEGGVLVAIPDNALLTTTAARNHIEAHLMGCSQVCAQNWAGFFETKGTHRASSFGVQLELTLALVFQRYADSSSAEYAMPVMHRLAAKNFFRAYGDILPDPPNPLPFHYAPTQLALLEGSMLHAASTQKLEELRYVYKLVCARAESTSQSEAEWARGDAVKPCLPGFGQVVTFSLFLWAYGAVTSRAFLKVDNTAARRKETVMIPLIDMANHASPPHDNAFYRYNPTIGAFELLAKKPMQQGDAVLVNYGITDNSQAMMNYGFATDAPGVTSIDIDFKVQLAAAAPSDGGSEVLLRMPVKLSAGGAANFMQAIRLSHMAAHVGKSASRCFDFMPAACSSSAADIVRLALKLIVRTGEGHQELVDGEGLRSLRSLRSALSTMRQHFHNGFHVVCPSSCAKTGGRVWGGGIGSEGQHSNYYSVDSNFCRSARHALIYAFHTL